MTEVQLPAPVTDDQLTVAQAVRQRRSRRRFREEPISLQALAQLLWCAQGVTGPRGRKRAVPSAGATFPMELYAAVGVGGVEGLDEGLYAYRPEGHVLEKLLDGDLRGDLAAAALGQDFVARAPVAIVMAALYSRTAGRYGERAQRYVDMEAGHISQNIYLQAEALGLATVAVGAFDDQKMAQAAHLPTDQTPLYVMPVGFAA